MIFRSRKEIHFQISEKVQQCNLINFKSSTTLASVFLKYLFMGLNVVESWFVEAQHKLLSAAGAETLRNMQFDN